jgi:serine/threonine-protein kinase
MLAIFEQVAQTVAYAHSRGVIHRDLKPLNIMVGAFGEVQVMDWGLAKVLGTEGHDAEAPPAAAMSLIRTVRSDSALDASVAGSVMGTPAYMAPEQALGMIALVDERADVFGLGSILCEILTGAPAYAGRSMAEVLRQAESANLIDAWSRLETCGADGELVALAKSCLAARPGDRPREAGAVAQAVTAHVSGVQERLRASELARVEAAAQVQAERMQRRFRMTLAGAVLIAVLVGGGSWIAFRTIRGARIAETDRTVGAALTHAETLLAEARREGIADLDAWTRAVSAAEKAEDLLSGRVARPGLEARVDGVLATANREAAAVRTRVERIAQGRAMLDALEEARLQGAAIRDDGLAITAEIQAFRESRIDPGPHRPEELAAFAATADRGDRERIAAVLDDWARREADGPGKDRLTALARTVDPDPYRDRLRRAMMARDRAALAALARADAADALPAASVVLLANALAEGGARPDALALLMRAQRRHPDHFWVNQALGRSFGAVTPRRWDEAARYFTAAVALRPASAGARFHLGLALHHLGRPEEAAARPAPCRPAPARLASSLAPGPAAPVPAGLGERSSEAHDVSPVASSTGQLLRFDFSTLRIPDGARILMSTGWEGSTPILMRSAPRSSHVSVALPRFGFPPLLRGRRGRANSPMGRRPTPWNPWKPRRTANDTRPKAVDFGLGRGGTPRFQPVRPENIGPRPNHPQLPKVTESPGR